MTWHLQRGGGIKERMKDESATDQQRAKARELGLEKRTFGA